MKPMLLILCFLISSRFISAQTDTLIRIESKEGQITITKEDRTHSRRSQHTPDTLSPEQKTSLQADIIDNLLQIEQKIADLRTAYGNRRQKDREELVPKIEWLGDDLEDIESQMDRYYHQIDSLLHERYDYAEKDYEQLRELYEYTIDKHHLPDVRTRWLTLLDLGFSTYFEDAPAPLINDIDPTSADIGRSVAVTIHAFQQRVNIYDHHLHFIWGAGIQSNTYAFDRSFLLLEEQGKVTFEHTPDIDYDKNRLRANYIHLPVMLNLESYPVQTKRSFRLNLGAYLNILYSSNLKTKVDGNKTKIKDNFNLNRFQTGLLAQLGYGPVTLYGTIGLNRLFDEDEDSGYDLIPISFGIRVLPF